MSFKKTKVVMLPTEKSSDIILRTRGNVIHQKKYYGTAWEDMGDVYQHLYFLSDDEIKEGDWVLLANNSIVKAIVGKYELDTIIGFNTGIGNVVKRFSKSDRKIIATTDRLEIPYQFDKWSIIPQPSEGFIQKFVDFYNSGKPITEVDVEYEKVKQALSMITKKTKNGTDYTEVEWEFQDILKINPKDNTITIKKAKDSWTRDEVISLLQQFNNDKSGVFDCTKWIEENL